ncbi:MAG: NAD-dependent epimerase/dehydratase family protein [Candidatus Atribacteria bacterium]|nr:NAD-dependent epimerase/dehydratase family protein [Candidatus Atribacteria bacterium]
MTPLISRRILITGGAGFIGYHLASALAGDDDNDITLVDNFVRGRDDLDLSRLIDRDNVHMVTGDLTDRTIFDQLGLGYDEVYHLAAIIGVQNVMMRPHEVVRINAMSTLLLLEWFVNGGGKKLLFSSTSEAYAWTQQFYPLPVPTPEMVPLALTDLGNPRATYAGSKIFGELAVTQYGQHFHKPIVIVRYHNVYGPRMGFEHVIPQIYKRVLDGQNPLLVYSADHRRAFCYVSDSIDATIACLRQPIADGRTFNIGNDQEEISMADLAERIARKAGKAVELQFEPAAHDPILRRCPDLSAIKSALGYQPQINLDHGLDLTLAWYAKAYAQ